MRDWKINPEFLCDKHLLGNHVELHMAVGCLKKGISLNGYIETGLLEIHNFEKRHAEIVLEMKKRGFNHKSALPYYKKTICGKIDAKKNILELKKRCKECRKRINKLK